jgi:hypothetical protein
MAELVSVGGPVRALTGDNGKNGTRSRYTGVETAHRQPELEARGAPMEN